MYSLEKWLNAVKLYFELGNNAALTVRRLGYPDVTSLAHWIDEYQRDQSLHARKCRYSKYSDNEKERAIRYYMENGKNILQTVKTLGYPSRPLLKTWIEEYDPAEAERRCQIFKSHVRCTQEQQEQAVRESCRGDLTISEIAAIYNVTPSAVSIWRKKLLGEGRKKVMSETPNEDKDVVRLKKEQLELEAKVEALKKEAYRLQLENDVLKKAAELLKKIRASVLKRSPIETRP
jgi:transposase-like protein